MTIDRDKPFRLKSGSSASSIEQLVKKIDSCRFVLTTPVETELITLLHWCLVSVVEMNKPRSLFVVCISSWMLSSLVYKSLVLVVASFCNGERAENLYVLL